VNNVHLEAAERQELDGRSSTMPDPTQGRKYGRNHLQMRRKYGIALERAGKQGLPCSRCRKPVVSLTMSWDLHHLDGAGPDVYAGVAHSKCNRATAGSGLANA
jgi:hypothetical protein